MSKQYRIYIAGKVTGLPYQATFNKFLQVEEMLKHLGQEVVNPMRVVTKGTEWQLAMKQCLSELTNCNAIFLIDDWQYSNGARLEYHIANMLEYTLINDDVIEHLNQQKATREQLLNPED